VNAVVAELGAYVVKVVNVVNPKENKAMTNKRNMTWALAALLVLATGVSAWAADPNAANTEDGLTIRITPNADYGVTIDTANVGVDGGVIDLGAMDLYTSTWTVRPATVTITGTVSKRGAQGGQELDVTARILTANGWIFDSTPTTDALGGAVDELAMFLLMSGTDISVAPSGINFAQMGDAAEVTDAGAAGTTSLTYRAGGAGGTGTKFEFGGTDLDQMSVNDKKHLWMYFRLPSETSTGNAQDIAVTLTATGTSL
jgi:hypothetical protein